MIKFYPDFSSKYEYYPFNDFTIILAHPNRGYNNIMEGMAMNLDLDYTALGERIHRIRKEHKMTQSLLAEHIGIEPSNISHIERGASKVGLGTLVKIANELGCSVDDLLCDSIVCEREAFECQLANLTKDCAPEELRMITDMAAALKTSMRKRQFK